MLTAVVFWVLMASDATSHDLVAQQFVSEAGCMKAKKFLEETRGTYMRAACIEDRAPASPKPHKATPETEQRP